MRTSRRRYVRRMPKIYGNLQPRERRWSPSGLFRVARKVLPYVIAMLVIYVVIASSLFRVKTVEVRGAALSDPAAIEQLVPKGGSIWTFPKGTVAASISKDPAVQDVRIWRGLPSSILVEVTERSAKALWVTGATASVLDAQGVVYLQYATNNLPAPDTAIGKTLASLPRIDDTSGLGAEDGQQVASTLFLQFVNDVQTQLVALIPNYVATSFQVGATTYDVTVMTKEGMKVELNSLGDAGVQIRNVARLVRDGDLNGAQVADLRVDRWAYVK